MKPTLKIKSRAALLGMLTLATTAVSPAANFNSNFNNNFGFFFSRVFLNFNNEKEGMDVFYRPFNIFLSGGVVVLQSRKTSNASGGQANAAWLQTGSLFPPFSRANAVGRTIRQGGQANDAFNWGGFWTLFDTVQATGQGWNYYENDVMETYNLGQFANRYTFKNPNTNGVVVRPGEFNAFEGGQFVNIRRRWANHSVSWTTTQTVINSGGTLQKTITGTFRGGNHRLILQNRPWPRVLNQIGVNQQLSSFVFDACNGSTP